MAENLSLICKGVSEASNRDGTVTNRETRTYVIEGVKLIKSEESGQGWSCNWSRDEIYCKSKDPAPSTITLDRIQGTVKSVYVLTGSSNALGFFVMFNGTCKAAKNKKF